MLLDPTFLDPASPNGIRAQLEGFTHVSPLAPLIQAVALPYPVAIGALMALGEIAVGLGALTGIAYRLAAVGGAVISFTLLLTASWTVRPYYLGNDLPYVLGWVTLAAAGSGGVLVLGPWLERKFGLRRTTKAMRRGAPATEEVASPGRRLFLDLSVLGAATLLVGAVAGGLRTLLPTGTTSGTIGTPGPTSSPDRRTGRGDTCTSRYSGDRQRHRERERSRYDVGDRLRRCRPPAIQGASSSSPTGRSWPTTSSARTRGARSATTTAVRSCSNVPAMGPNSTSPTMPGSYRARLRGR